MIKLLRDRIGEHPFHLLKGLASYGSAEMAVRLVRLFVVLLIARRLAPDIVGVAALTLSVFELVRVLANIGVGQQIIAADEALLDATCNTAHRIFWGWCGGVAMVQLAASLVLGSVFHQILAGEMLAVLSLVYLTMPAGLVQCYLLIREGRASTTARTSATQTIADHLLTALLLSIWPTAWAIVLPKLLTAPIWLVLTRRARHWRPKSAAGFITARTLFAFGATVLATEMIIAARGQLDKIIIASMLGVTALGTYFFAYNAGIGIVSSLISAFGTVIYPSLCNAKGAAARTHALRIALLIGAAIFLPVIALQSSLSWLYVPLVFGPKWAHAAPLIGVLCLGGIPMIVAAVTTDWLRSEGRAGFDAFANALSCALALGGLALGTLSGSLLISAMCWIGGLSLGVLPYSLRVLGRGLARPVAQNYQEILI
jgi:O-antigen/teichoic acid export membrane protein